MNRRLLTSAVLLVVLASGCKCSGKQTPPRAPEPASGCRDGSQEEVVGLERTVDVDGDGRRYILDVPAGSASEPRPVLLSFHGIGGTPGPLREVTELGDKGRGRGFIVVHPKGEMVWLKGRAGPGWEIKAEGNQDVALVAALIDQLDSLYCIDRKRVFAAGFSNGAHLAHVLGCQMPDAIAAIGAVGGGLNEMSSKCGPVKPVPAAIFHGDADSIVGVEEGREAHAFWTKRNGCTGEVKVEKLCTLHTGCEKAPGVLYCELPSFGHAWPGGFPGDPIDATDLLLDFFSGSLEPDPEEPPPEPQETKMTIHFSGKVKKVQMLSKVTGEVIPVHFDPRWAATVEIASVDEADAPLQAGTVVVFAIHSPAKLFKVEGKKAVGGTYDFELDVTETGGALSYGLMKVP
ncbi:MAG: hypothetical protein JRG91_10665 [Deltaproteobacteria bacterium]|nr:hypothetical protein [Deltaproteobacteria bacterium]